MHDRQISVRLMTDELSVSKTSLYEIMIDDLAMKKVCTRWVLKLQRANRVVCCVELVENCNQDPIGSFGRIMTRDETWIHHYDPLNQRSMVHITHHSFTDYVLLFGRNLGMMCCFFTTTHLSQV